MQLLQQPAPGTRWVRYRGDTLRIRLELDRPAAGRACLRTNLGRAAVRRAEQRARVEAESPPRDADWHDRPMRPDGPQAWVVDVPLDEVGRFEAKTCFLPEGRHEPQWPPGPNITIKVEPAHTRCANGVYTAFVRQFGPNRGTGAEDGHRRRLAAELDEAGYTVIPRSGRFRELIGELDHIVGRLGFRWIHLLPVHPVPTTYARMGRYGSPFAPLDFLAVDPALAVFDRRTTPLQQFEELIDATHARGAFIMMDIPANHTGWASQLQVHHPDWFKRGQDHTFKSPGAWGVTWEDLSELEYARDRGLWRHMAGVFLYWCRRGVDGFRCDAGYMVPAAVWAYITACVREEFPDTVFLLEGLGGPQAVTERLLDDANLDWAYTELFQQPDRSQIEAYHAVPQRLAAGYGLPVHFAETHDNTRLAAVSSDHARVRVNLAALLAHAGAFGVTNGVEWLARERVDVHGAPGLNWGAEENLVDDIARLNALLAAHPVFEAGASVRLLDSGPCNALAVLRHPLREDGALLGLLNLDTARAAEVQWPATAFDPPPDGAWDLLTGERVTPARRDGRLSLRLPPGGALWLAPVPFTPPAGGEPPPVQRQRARAGVLDAYRAAGLELPADDGALEALAAEWAADPAGFWMARMPDGALTLTAWEWPADRRRRVPWPGAHALCVRAPHPFRADLVVDGRTRARLYSQPAARGGHQALAMPPGAGSDGEAVLRLHLLDPAGPRRDEARLRVLPAALPALSAAADVAAVRRDGLYAIATNGTGAMAQVRAAWGEIESQYDCLLGANLDPEVPVDRHILFTRCRAWIVLQGYSCALNGDCLRHFAREADGAVRWEFRVPVGCGRSIDLVARLRLATGENRVWLTFARRAAAKANGDLADNAPVRLILRPDIEDRINHHKTKAYAGPEQAWPSAVRREADGFRFEPAPGRALHLTVRGGAFTWEPEWTYMVSHPHEAGRGLDAHSDLYSPGYLQIDLRGGETACLQAAAGAGARENAPPAAAAAEAEPVPLRTVLERALDAFIVRRRDRLTVMAGYPWFLDWGRDTLICLRGIIAAGRHEAAGRILEEFARYERDGTLPNMLIGRDDTNRDTSDAPLWFVAACDDLVRAAGTPAWLQTDCGGRTVRDVILSIVHHYHDGTPNGIGMDWASGLVFSPSHFTWMDTNHPAGTPREGYPVEIQALWHHALLVAADLDPEGRWRDLARLAADSVRRLFPVAAGPDRFLADCLHARPGQAAAEAQADDHLRPNQLFAVSLGAVADPDLGAAVLRACQCLLVPGGIRSLADRPVRTALPVHWNGRLLNDPHHPYRGTYQGDEDTARKPAYHNGTVWTWPLPAYVEGLLRVHGPAAVPTARALLGSAADVLRIGCWGQVPEILDGDAPHTPRGCGAQAWGVTELLRVLALVEGG